MNMPVTGSERVKKIRGKSRKYRPENGKTPLGFLLGPFFTVSQTSGDGGGSGGKESCLLLKR